MSPSPPRSCLPNSAWTPRPTVSSESNPSEKLVELRVYPAQWDQHGKAAGPRRNQLMLEGGKPDVVWCFISRPLDESRGTADMVRRARAAGVPTYVVSAT